MSDEDDPMTTLSLSLGLPEPSLTPEQGRDLMRAEVQQNLDRLDRVARDLELSEIEVREAFADLQQKLVERGRKADGYNARVRDFNRMLGLVAQIRQAMGDDEPLAMDTLDYVLPEVSPYAEAVWPEGQWPQSDLVDPEAFDLTEIIGG